MGREKGVGEEVVNTLCVQKLRKSRHLVRKDKTRRTWHKIYFFSRDIRIPTI